jgi:hypothetical protein
VPPEPTAPGLSGQGRPGRRLCAEPPGSPDRSSPCPPPRAAQRHLVNGPDHQRSRLHRLLPHRQRRHQHRPDRPRTGPRPRGPMNSRGCGRGGRRQSMSGRTGNVPLGPRRRRHAGADRSRGGSRRIAKPPEAVLRCGSARTAAPDWSAAACGTPAGGSPSRTFASAHPDALVLARRYVALLASLGDVQVIPQRTRLVCVARVRLAGLEPRKDGFLASFALRRWLPANPRIVKTVGYGPRWRAHHVRVRSEPDLDEELRTWLQEAHDTVGLQSDLPPAGGSGFTGGCLGLGRSSAAHRRPAAAPHGVGDRRTGRRHECLPDHALGLAGAVGERPPAPGARLRRRARWRVPPRRRSRRRRRAARRG